MPKEKMVGSQLLMPPALKERVRALARARGSSEAEVVRVALEGGGLRALERQYADKIKTLG